MDLELSGKRAVVTGAGSGIGRATALALAREGVQVSLVGRTRSTLDDTLSSLPVVQGGHRVDVVDLFSRQAVEDFTGSLTSDWGGVHILVNNACSFAALNKIHEMDPGHWDEFVSGNLRGVFLMCRGLLPSMEKLGYGRIINIGSLTSELGSSHYGEYATVKAGISGLTYNLAVDYSSRGITTNCVQPGFIATERLKQAAPPKLVEVFKRATSVKRLGRPEEVADLIVFLSSARASYISGTVIRIGGGAGLNNLW